VVGLARVGDQPVRLGNLRQCDATVERLDEVRVDALVGKSERSGIDARELVRKGERRQPGRLVKKL
jgi:hypothetical protein